MLENLSDLYNLSSSHDLEHIGASALYKHGLLGNDEVSQKFIKQQMIAIYRWESINYEMSQIFAAFENAKIPFVPLKGAIIRALYPEPWMRTSCDIDILIKENDFEKARSVLVDEYGCIYHGKGSHDISLFTPTDVHVELHYDLVEEGIANESYEVLKSVWDMACVREGSSNWYEMSDEMFYFYHIAHMAKHFEIGGCGIRPFIDLWILDHIDGCDKGKREALLERGKLLRFAEAARKLCRIWCEDEEHDTVSLQMENYILCGGVYGTRENRVMIQQQKNGGRFKYAMSRIFLPYDTIKFHYPILQKHKWLTPIMQVRRWFKLVFGGKAKRSINELKYNHNVTTDKANEMKQFLTNIGL